jgi:hypothetical protein
MVILASMVLRNSGMDMKTSTDVNREAEGFGCFQQILAHLGGMTRAWWRGRPIHFAFHGRGIYRAIFTGVKFPGWLRSAMLQRPKGLSPEARYS